MAYYIVLYYIILYYIAAYQCNIIDVKRLPIRLGNWEEVKVHHPLENPNWRRTRLTVSHDAMSSIATMTGCH